MKLINVSVDQSIYSDKKIVKKSKDGINSNMTPSDKKAVTAAIFPILVELKCAFLNSLPAATTIRDRRNMMFSIDKACGVVINMDVRLFDIEE